MKRPWDAVAWWEVRRIPYNLLIAVLGLATIFITVEVSDYFVRLGYNAQVPLGPPGLFFGIIAYGIAANVCYTLGWFSELLWSGGDTSRTEPMRRTVFWAGVIVSAFITVSPAILVLAVWALFGVKN